jgi:uncharacterized zinc-type alcohol dehydrogenase-like protein
MAVPLTKTYRAFLVENATDSLHQGEIKRRELRDTDVSIKIHYCGICHSDLHMARNEWGMSQYPMVPGHEIAGVVDAVGSKVTKFKVGDRVGVGCVVDSCQKCDHCTHENDQTCREGMTMTYGWADKISPGNTTFGGYSEGIVVEDRYVLRIPDGLDLADAAPLLCAGITSWTPLMQAHVGPGTKVGVVGIGGLGHLAVKFARALGATVTAFTSKASKKAELIELGANDVVVTSDPEDVKRVDSTLDVIVDTVSADHDIISLINALVFGGRYHLVGAPTAPLKISSFPIIMKEIKVTGSGVGGIQSTQAMLDLCAEKKVAPIIEIGALKDVNHLYERLEKGDVRFRFVLDIKGHFQ